MIAITIILLIFIVALAFLAWKFSNKNAIAGIRIAQLEEKLNAAETEVSRLNAENTSIQQANTQALEKQNQQFELLARRIIDEQSTTLRQNHNREINALLDPLKTEITSFRKQVVECYDKEARERFSLAERIKELAHTNTSIEKEARQLSSALRGNTKFQGDWGEMVLESILSKTSLREGLEYFTQMASNPDGTPIRSDEGRILRPDVVVNYPDRGFVVIDSKVSLTAYTDYVNAETDASRDEQGRKHLMSVVKHIKELEDKAYQDYVGSTGKLDFVIMFIPSEGAYSAALQLDPTLWQKAYDKRVLITSPTQLVGALRLIEQMWRHDSQERNAQDIATKAGALYDKFVAMLDDIRKTQRTLKSASDSLDTAINKLSAGRGNIISRVEKLKELGAKTSKQMPEIENREIEA